MTLKKDKIISIIGMVGISFLFHNMYKWFPNFLTSIFFPVNESIFQHMKLLYSIIFFYGLVEYIIIRIFDLKVNNYFSNLFLISILSIPIYLIMFLPLYYFFGENLFISIVLMVITFIIIEIISYQVLNLKNNSIINILGIILIIIGYIGMTYLTYNPIKIDFFKDSTNNTYEMPK